jgi:hypothetical protein
MDPYFAQQLAGDRIQTRLREAEDWRRGAETRGVRVAQHRASIRRIATAAVHVLMWPVRH